jgi:tape measure domain-containing protein
VTDRVIRVVLDSSGVRRGASRTKKELTGVQQKAKAVTGQFKAAAKAASAFAAALAIREIVNLTNTYQSLQNQLRIVTDSQEQLNATSERLFEIAQATRQPLESVTQLFSRAAIAAGELGASEEQLFRLTEITGKALAIQGSSAAESSGALRQLSQAFASGIVRAEEFNSILEGAFPLALAAARGIDEAGGSVGRLRALIVAGEITSKQFFDGLLKGGNELDTQFAKSLTTISQAFTEINNSLISFVGRISESSGAGAGLAQVLESVSGGIDDLGDAFFGTLKPTDEVNGALQLFVSVALIAVRVVDTLASSLFNLAKTGFTLVGETLGASTAAIVQFAKGNSAEAKAIFDDLDARNLATITNNFRDLRDDLISDTSGTIESLIKLWDVGARDIAERTRAVREGGAGGGGAGGPVVDPDDFRDAEDAVLAFITTLENQEQILALTATLGDDAGRAILEFKDSIALASAESAIFKDLAPTPEVEALRDAFLSLGEGAFESIRLFNEEIAAGALSEAFDDQILALQEEIELLGASNEALAANAQLRALAAGATVEQAERIGELTEVLLNETDELRKQEDILTGFFEELGRSAQRELSGFLADPLSEGLDELPLKFARLLQQLAADALASEIFQILKGFGSSGSGGGAGGFLQFVGGLFGGGFAAGGQVSGSRPVLVGERGPEIFTPPGAGAITPNVNINQAAQAPPMVTVVNTIDTAEITGAFNSGAGDTVLLNRIGARRTAFRQALGV